MHLRLLTLLALAPLAACGTPPPESARTPAPDGPAPTATTRTPTPSPTPAEPTCASVVAAMSPDDRVGQLFMVGKPATSAVDADYRAMLAETRTGQVILLENTSAGATGVKKLADDVRAGSVSPGGVRPLVAADQEGGLVQRLKGSGFTTIPSAVEQAAMADADLQRAAEGWGRELRAAGIDVDLAPVTDTVPSDVGRANEPIGALRRGYGATPDKVTPKANAFIRGMDAAGVATSVKHFPNLGRVKGNTDLQANVTDATTTRTDAALAPFREGIAAGADMVMVSTAVYSRIDPGTPATFSKVVIGDMIRGDLGFDGVVISDDMGAAKQVASVKPGDRAVRFVAAGGDVVINGDPSLQRAMVTAVRERAASDQAFAAQVTRSAGRVVAYKAQHGAASCR
ncbi:glycoside hydrolase family 3 N-terminal domain-containing protein [Mariniluteicoccus flavus]